MTKQELLKILSQNGWAISTDESGDKLAILEINDRLVSVIPSFRKLKEGQSLTMRESVSSIEFSNAISYIGGDNQLYYSLKTRFGESSRSQKFSQKEVLEIVEEIVNWACNFDFNRELEAKRKLPTNSPGIYPLHHLAALALGGESRLLSDYLHSFREGDRLGFVPYITEECIVRSLELSEPSNVSN